MRKWLTPIVAAVLSAAVLAPTPAGAASDRKCSFDLTFLTAPVNVSGTPPLSGATESRAATVDGKLCGKQFHGASRLTITYTGPTTPNTVLFAIFGPLGSLKGTAHAIGMRQPDGSVSLSGGGNITHGTGLYKGATGSFSTTGTRPANSIVNTVQDVGTVRF
jgi:hypothetical protein